MKYVIIILKYIAVFIGIMLIIAGTTFVDNDAIYQPPSIGTYEDNAKAIVVGEVPPVISNDTYKLHGHINRGQSACEGYKLKLKGSHMTADVKKLGQYLFENMPIGHNIIEIYDENDNYLDMFEVIFNEGYADSLDDTHKIIYIDLKDTNSALAFKDKYEVSFGIDELGMIHFDEIGPFHDIIGDIELILLDKTVNLYGQIVNECASPVPLPDIKIEVENTDISCTTDVDGDFVLPNVPIRKQRLNFYDANGEYISGVDILFNIDGGDICLNKLEKIIIDVGNSDGRIFTNMQIGFEINLENKSLGYEQDKIHGNVESPENRMIYFLICALFVLVFFFIMILIDKKRSDNLGSIER